MSNNNYSLEDQSQDQGLVHFQDSLVFTKLDREQYPSNNAFDSLLNANRDQYIQQMQESPMVVPSNNQQMVGSNMLDNSNVAEIKTEEQILPAQQQDLPKSIDLTLQFEGKDEKESIRGIEVERDDQGNIRLNPVLAHLHTLGFQVVNTSISFLQHDQHEKRFELVGLYPMNKNLLLLKSDIGCSSKVHLRMRSVPPSQQEQFTYAMPDEKHLTVKQQKFQKALQFEPSQVSLPAMDTESQQRQVIANVVKPQTRGQLKKMSKQSEDQNPEQSQPQDMQLPQPQQKNLPSIGNQQPQITTESSNSSGGLQNKQNSFSDKKNGKQQQENHIKLQNNQSFGVGQAPHMDDLMADECMKIDTNKDMTVQFISQGPKNTQETDCMPTGKKVELTKLSQMQQQVNSGQGTIVQQNISNQFQMQIGSNNQLAQAGTSSSAAATKRKKERSIREIIEKVTLWRKLYNGVTSTNGTLLRYSLEDAATRVAVSKKSLDDYLLQIRFGKKYGFDFTKHKEDKVGTLRKFVKLQKAIEKTNKGKNKISSKDSGDDELNQSFAEDDE